MLSRDRFTLIIALLMGAAIGFGTLMPGTALPAVPGSDKIQHLGAFALAALVITLLRPGWVALAAVALIAYGGVIELIQPSVGRSRDIGDFFANVTGVVIGSILGLALTGLGSKWRSLSATWRGQP